MMRAVSPSTSDLIIPDLQLRVRFGPLMRWFFIGFFLFAEIYLATRVWGGWRPRALLQLLAIQVFFAPRLLFAGFAFAAIATVFTDRLVKWVARPLSLRWLSPQKGLPSESELPLFLRVGERLEKPIRARRKIDHGWEPGWLIITDQRLFWLSGVWRMISFELSRNFPSDPLLSHFAFAPAPHWLAGFVTGMPPRIVIDLTDSPTCENRICEVIAMASPKDLLEYLQPGLLKLFDEMNESLTESLAREAAIKSSTQIPTRNLQRSLTASEPPKSTMIALPPRRERNRVSKPVKVVEEIPNEPLHEVRGIQLPPRRRRR